MNSPKSLRGIPILIRNTNPYTYRLYGNIIFHQNTFMGTHTGHQNGDQKENCTFPYLEYQFVYQFISITFTGTLFSIKSPLEEHREVIKRGSERKLHVSTSGMPIRSNTYRENKSFIIPILRGNTNSPQEYQFIQILIGNSNFLNTNPKNANHSIRKINSYLKYQLLSGNPIHSNPSREY